MKTWIMIIVVLWLNIAIATTAPPIKSIEASAIRPWLPVLNLELMAFENGIVENDETYWCEEHFNNIELYSKALNNDLKDLNPSPLLAQDVQDFKEAYNLLFELCNIADAPDFLESEKPKYTRAFDKIQEIREILIQELP